MTFLQIVTNTIIAVTSLVIALAILPRLRLKLNFTVWSGIVFFILLAAQYVDVTLFLLFSDTPAAVVHSWHLLAIRCGLATAILCFVAGIYIDVAQWKQLQHTMSRKSDPPA